MGKTEVGYPEGGKKYEGSEKNFGKDPRSEIVTNQDKGNNQIDKGTKVEVQGQQGMLASKKRKATWY